MATDALERKVEAIQEQIADVHRCLGELGRVDESVPADLAEVALVAALYSKAAKLETLHKSIKSLCSAWLTANTETGLEVEIGGVRVCRYHQEQPQVKVWQDWARGPFGDEESKSAMAAYDYYKSIEQKERGEFVEITERVKVSIPK